MVFNEFIYLFIIYSLVIFIMAMKIDHNWRAVEFACRPKLVEKSEWFVKCKSNRAKTKPTHSIYLWLTFQTTRTNLKFNMFFFCFFICSTQPRCLSGQELTHRYNFNQMNLAAFEATEMKCHKMSLVIGFDCKRPLKCTNIRTLKNLTVCWMCRINIPLNINPRLNLDPFMIITKFVITTQETARRFIDASIDWFSSCCHYISNKNLIFKLLYLIEIGQFNTVKWKCM